MSLSYSNARDTIFEFFMSHLSQDFIDNVDIVWQGAPQSEPDKLFVKVEILHQLAETVGTGVGTRLFGRRGVVVLRFFDTLKKDLQDISKYTSTNTCPHRLS